jgi:hypothetical protein
VEKNILGKKILKFTIHGSSLREVLKDLPQWREINPKGTGDHSKETENVKKPTNQPTKKDKETKNVRKLPT